MEPSLSFLYSWATEVSAKVSDYWCFRPSQSHFDLIYWEAEWISGLQQLYAYQEANTWHHTTCACQCVTHLFQYINTIYSCANRISYLQDKILFLCYQRAGLQDSLPLQTQCTPSPLYTCPEFQSLSMSCPCCHLHSFCPIRAEEMLLECIINLLSCWGSWEVPHTAKEMGCLWCCNELDWEDL